jgi:hypothetical protein
VAVGRAVWRGVGVGRGVAGGEAVGIRTGGPDAPEPGVGVGPRATIGPLADGSRDGVVDDAGGADSDAPRLGFDPAEPAGAELDPADPAGLPRPTTAGLEVATPPATCWSGRVGVSRPAVNATVARIRLRSPRATTRRARWAEVTRADGLLPTRRRSPQRDSAMVAPEARRAPAGVPRSGRPRDPDGRLISPVASRLAPRNGRARIP